MVLISLLLLETGGRNPPPSQVINADPEPWGFRGGLSGEFQVQYVTLLYINRLQTMQYSA